MVGGFISSLFMEAPESSFTFHFQAFSSDGRGCQEGGHSHNENKAGRSNFRMLFLDDSFLSIPYTTIKIVSRNELDCSVKEIQIPFTLEPCHSIVRTHNRAFPTVFFNGSFAVLSVDSEFQYMRQ